MPVCKDSVAECSNVLNDVNNNQTCSSAFRVEKLDDNCVTCRVLADNPDSNSLNPYVATNSFFTMDLSCCCAIRCLTDTYVDCI